MVYQPSKLTEILGNLSDPSFLKINCSNVLYLRHFKDTKKVEHFLESCLDFKFFLMQYFINYRKLKTIFMSPLNSHIYWDTQYKTDSSKWLLRNCYNLWKLYLQSRKFPKFILKLYK